MRILIVDEDRKGQDNILMALKTSGLNAEAVTGEECLDLVRIYDYDLVVMAIDGGLALLRTIRAEGNTVPVMAITGVDTVASRVGALSAGADDCVAKPVHKSELAARVNAVVRRSNNHATSVVTAGDLAIDLDKQTVTVGDHRVRLTGREYQILESLALRKGVTLTKEMLLDRVYGGMDEPEVKIIDVYVCKLRKKLAAASDGADFIETVWGRGYALADPATIRKAA